MALNLILSFLAFSAGGEGGGGLLDVNPGVFVWTIVTFIALLLILKKLAWKPILNSLDEREKLIKESLEKADLAREEAAKQIEANKANIAKAEADAQQVIEQAREYAEKLKAQALDESKAGAQKMIEDAKVEIERKNKEAFNSLKDQIAGIAINAAEKIIRENLDQEKQSKLVDKLIDELPKN